MNNIDSIHDDDGVCIVLEQLDKLYLKGKLQFSYQAYDKFRKFKRPNLSPLPPPHPRSPISAYFFWKKICSIITLHIGDGRVSVFFVMLRDGKQGGWMVLDERS